ncbi:restriction endonuclease subunit S [Pseudomonas schmalbachii]|uniref:Restriction endonuclease subunit S n=1 Tax=Pseudomonas schmalbachii TaxID=2816993 RepID=A0ABS3TXW5_9PSED|nr:restriction endonuclease subunit S [Pseudomonas schmalbachii]MBO3277439.1 restriction endonuclease subunit S [Pseudomonas schmalbachii]
MNWPIVNLGDLSEAIMGQAPPGEDCNKSGVGTPFVKAGEFGVERPIIREWTTNPLKFAKASDVLLCVVGATCGKINKGADCAIGRSVAAIRANKEKLDKDYMYYFLSSWTGRLRAMSQGAAQTVISKEMIERLEIPLPPLPEQKRIASILGKVDTIRRKRQQAIQLADDFLRAVFLDMFGDPVTNPKGLVITSIGELCEVVTGATPSRGVDEYYEGDIPWVKTTEVDGHVICETEECITDKGLHSSNCKLNPVGSIVMAMYGQGKTRGKVGVLGVEAATNQACAVVRPSSKIMMGYLYFYLQVSYEALRSLGQGAGQPNLNLSIVKSFPVPLPSEVEQMDFVRLYESVGILRGRSAVATQESSDFFNSLSQKAFAGQL